MTKEALIFAIKSIKVSRNKAKHTGVGTLNKEIYPVFIQY